MKFLILEDLILSREFPRLRDKFCNQFVLPFMCLSTLVLKGLRFSAETTSSGRELHSSRTQNVKERVFRFVRQYMVWPHVDSFGVVKSRRLSMSKSSSFLTFLKVWMRSLRLLSSWEVILRQLLRS